MSAFLYGVALQWRLDIRSKSLLITCYIVPLLFFAIMGGIFTALNPAAKDTLIQSMTVMGVSMGALLGLPPSLVEIYGSDIKNAYKANSIPIYFGLATLALSTFIHLLIMSAILYVLAPIAFDAAPPASLPLFLGALVPFLLATLGIGCILGLTIKNQAKLTMLSQLLFLPSIMLSGIMFPIDLLPKGFAIAGKLLPAAWGFAAMTNAAAHNLYPLLLFFVIAVIACGILLRKKS